jgi:hypothetical protein
MTSASSHTSCHDVHLQINATMLRHLAITICLQINIASPYSTLELHAYMSCHPTNPRTRPSGNTDNGTSKHHTAPQTLRYSVVSTQLEAPCQLHKTVAAAVVA